MRRSIQIIHLASSYRPDEYARDDNDEHKRDGNQHEEHFHELT